MIGLLKLEKYRAGYLKNQYLFDETSIKVLPGMVVGIIGTNGCGKSTFVKGILNLTPIKKGEIFLNSDRITNWETSKIFRTKQLGYLSQRERVFKHLTVNEHIKLQQNYSKNFVYRNTSIYERLFSIIEPKQKYFASSLSGGEQLILNIMCILILDPNTIILDEPSDSLDIKNKEFLLDILQSWKNENKSILIIEHDLNFLNNVSDTVIQLSEENRKF